MTTEYEQIVQERLRRHVAVIESACEAALQGGRHGVMVEWNSEVTRAWVSPDVPYGEVHERVIPTEQTCACEHPYIGTQKAGEPIRCERCRLLIPTDEASQ